jgi:hypothetical protein
VEFEMICGAKAVPAANNRFFVCETPIAGGHWFAQVEPNTALSINSFLTAQKSLTREYSSGPVGLNA